MISLTQLCWRYHNLSQSQWYGLYGHMIIIFNTSFKSSLHQSLINPCSAESVLRDIKYIWIVFDLSKLRWYRYLKCALHCGRQAPIYLHNQCHGYWCLGKVWSQGISHDIDFIIPWYFCFCFCYLWSVCCSDIFNYDVFMEIMLHYQERQR